MQKQILVSKLKKILLFIEKAKFQKKLFYNERASTAVFFIRIKLAITKLSITKTYRHGQAEVTSSSSPKTPKD
jgi:hypothetical protein